MFITAAGTFDLLWLSNCVSLANIYCITATTATSCAFIIIGTVKCTDDVKRTAWSFSSAANLESGVFFKLPVRKWAVGRDLSGVFAVRNSQSADAHVNLWVDSHLCVIIFDKQLSTTRFVFMIWTVLGSTMTAMLVQSSKFRRSFICTLNLLNVAPELTEQRNTDGKKSQNDKWKETCCGFKADSQTSYGWALACREKNKTHILSVMSGRTVRRYV